MRGVVGNERKIERVWDTSQQAKCNAFSEKGTLFLCLLRNLSHYKTRKGRERNGTETKNQGRAYCSGKSAVSRITNA